jgi:hypothetical protein
MPIRVVKAVGYEEHNRVFEENLRPYQAMDSEFKSEERQLPISQIPHKKKGRAYKTHF